MIIISAILHAFVGIFLGSICGTILFNLDGSGLAKIIAASVLIIWFVYLFGVICSAWPLIF